MVLLGEMDFLENLILDEWDNWVCIMSRALGVKVDRRSQSQLAGLEQGARERAEVLVFQKVYPAAVGPCICHAKYRVFIN